MNLSTTTRSSAAGWSRFAGPALILLAAAVATAPQLIRGASCGHDFDFHLVSWFDTLSSWRHGVFYPHWTPSANYGAGEPRFVFYPPLTWMLGAALGLVLPWQLVPVALTFLCLAVSGLATRKLAREALPDAAATLAGCAALFSGYALFTAYERSAFGELTGGFWIPLLLLFILRDRNPSVAISLWRRALDGSAAPLALVVAGAWLSNAPVGVMACYLAAAVALAAALTAKSWTPLVRTALGTAVGIALAAVYLLPAAIEQRWVDIRQATSDPGERIETSWLFAHNADPQLQLHDLELHRVSLIAVSMIAVAVAGLLLAWSRGKLSLGGRSEGRLFAGQGSVCRGFIPDIKPAKTGRALAPEACSSSQSQNGPFALQNVPLRYWLPLTLIPLAVLFLQFPVSLPIWDHLPKLRFLQFPWRWLVVLEAPVGIFFASAVWSVWPTRRWLRVALVAACTAAFVAASAWAGIRFFQSCYEEDAVPAMLSVYRTGAGFEGTGEYSPPDADNTEIATGLPAACMVTDPAVKLGVIDTLGANPDWWVEQHSCLATFDVSAAPGRDPAEHLRIHASLGQPGYLILRLCVYPAWRVTVNGRPVTAFPQREDGLMAVPVPQGSIDLAVDWAATPDVIAGRWLSALGVLALTALWYLERKSKGNSCPRL
ncbi:MAG: hypothetical protein ABSE87_00535 [Terracidiphilus sp.]